MTSTQTVSAKDKASGKESNIKITGSSGLNEDEINKMPLEAGESVSAEEKAKIEAAVKELKEVIAKDSATKDEIEVATRNLASASHKLAEAMYKKEGGEQAGAEQGAKAKKDDDVIDAEVE